MRAKQFDHRPLGMPADAASPGLGRSPRARLRDLGLRPVKRLSQSFLADQGVAAAIVRAARLDPSQHVLEIGPGLGVLTERLANAARRVVAVEIDPSLADGLRVDLAATNVEVHTDDVLKIDPSVFFEAPFVVVANLPYHITSPALRHLLSAGPPFASRLVVMVQAEVAARIAAPPGQMSALAVAIQAQARVRTVRHVGAAAFYPQPKVDSAVLLLEPLVEADRLVSRDDLPSFVELVQAGFKQPRKQLANSLAEGLSVAKDVALDRLRQAEIEPSLRPQVLTVADWVRLYPDQLTEVLYRSYAKINLTLEVIRKRPDGFHELASLVHTISLADDLRIDPADDLQTTTTGLQIDVADGDNLISRAARLLAAAANVKPGAELTLVKRIPAAAGLGGGSSDAATTLVGLNALWRTGLGISELKHLAAELGSDIPFFVDGGAALMQGRGEDVQALPALRAQWLALVVPGHTLEDKTRRLYAALEPGDFSSGATTHRAAACVLQGLPPNETDLVNGFSRAARAVFPDLAGVWQTAEQVCERRFFLSGAGPAIFALAPNRADAWRWVTRMSHLGLPAYAARTVKRARAARKVAADPPFKYA